MDTSGSFLLRHVRYAIRKGLADSDSLVRKFFIIYVARELRLIFPSSYATATTIRSMHLAAEGDSTDARLKVLALVKAFSFSLVLRVVSQYAIGILWVCTGNLQRKFSH